MAELSHDLTEFLNTHFHGPISRASKMAIRLMLAHHHVWLLDILQIEEELILYSVSFLPRALW